MHPVTLLSILFSVVMPQKMWYSPGQPVNVSIDSDHDITLVATDFSGKPMEPGGSNDIAAHHSADVFALYPRMANPGAYVLYAVPKGSSTSQDAAPTDFLGTPVVVEVLTDSREAGTGKPMVIHLVPLQYARFETDAGNMTAMFYYDAAPHTAETFLQLASEGYFDGLNFHRVVPGFVIQGGDPLGADESRAGTGGPGFHIDAEFNDHPHVAGVLSMARNGDPLEGGGAMPRAQYANSAGSQFFICLDYASTKQLDQKYTAFGKVVEGLDVAQKIGKSKVVNQETGKPQTPAIIQHIEVLPVSAGHDPYAVAATTEPSK